MVLKKLKKGKAGIQSCEPENPGLKKSNKPYPYRNNDFGFFNDSIFLSKNPM